MNAAPFEAPRLPQATEVAPSLIRALQVRGLRGDAGRPRRIEIVRGIEHRVRVHRHAMLARYRGEERAHGVLPAAPRHPRPLPPPPAEIFAAPALAPLDPARLPG